MVGRISKIVAAMIIATMLFVPMFVDDSSSEQDATEVYETIHISYYDEWRFDKDPHIEGLTLKDNCLTIDNVNISMVHRDLMRAISINQAEAMLKIIVKGDNTISHVNTTEVPHAYMSCCLYSRAPLEIVGEGDNPTLTLNTSDRGNFAYALLVERATKISDLNLICNAGDSIKHSYGIHADGTLTIENSTIQAITKTSELTVGISAPSVSLKVSNSHITATAGEASQCSQGIIAKAIIGDDTSIIATGGNVTFGDGYSVGVEMDMNESVIKGVKIDAIGGTSASKSYGIFFSKGCSAGSIDCAKITCEGKDSAILADGPSAVDRSAFVNAGQVAGSFDGSNFKVIGSGPISMDFKKVVTGYESPSDSTSVWVMIAIIPIPLLALIGIVCLSRRF